MPVPADLLPVVPAMAPLESLQSYVARVADANHLSVTALLGRTPFLTLWEQPGTPLLARISRLTNLPVSVLRRGTLTGRYPGTFNGGTHLGRRWRKSPAWCPSCGPSSDVELRLNILVTCLRCGRLLTDRCGYREDDVDPALADVQKQLRVLLGQRTADARQRLRRLQRIMRALGPAVSTSWPALAQNETWQRRAHAVDVEQRRSPGRTPAASAVLLMLAWDASHQRRTTTRLMHQAQLRAAAWTPPPGRAHLWPADDLTRARARLHRHLTELSIAPENVPSAITLGRDGILPPRNTMPVRAALAYALTRELLHQQGGRRPSCETTFAYHGVRPGEFVPRLTTMLGTSIDGLRLIADAADALVADGLRDVAQARAEFRTHRPIPPAVIGQLLPRVRTLGDVQVLASTWIWIDAAAGGLAGGPHPFIGWAPMQAFDTALTADGRLVLRDYWTQRLNTFDTLTTTLEPAAGRRQQRTRRRAG